MSLVKANWHPTDRQLRQFGVLCALGLPLVSWMWGGSGELIAASAIGGIVLAACAFAWPRVVAPVFIAAMLVTLPIGLILSELILFLVYALVFVPMGLVFRMLGRDRLARKLQPKVSSYWTPKAQPKSVASYYRQS